jgi:hypothetical protein
VGLIAALPVWQQAVLRYAASAIGAALILAALVNLAGGFGSGETSRRPSTQARQTQAVADIPWNTPAQSPPIHNVYYLVESQEHADRLISGAEPLPEAHEKSPDRVAILIAEQQTDVTIFNQELMSMSISQNRAGNIFTWELIDLRQQ